MIRVAVAGAIAAVAALLFLVVDVDGDGTGTWKDLGHALNPDVDSDLLADGWETDRGLDPTVPDMDGDGLLDGEEVALHADPRSVDTDRDGVLDGVEAIGVLCAAPRWAPDCEAKVYRTQNKVVWRDCDGDGVPSISSADDDGDGALDGVEWSYACFPDHDLDGLRDGLELNVECMLRPDCDYDGLNDTDEDASLGYSMLDGDSFDTGLPDSITRAFQEAGQKPGADDDGDGIPDGWESSSGLIEWGDLEPQVGRRDVLVEFVRIQGPSTDQFEDLSFDEAYGHVADFLADEGDLAMQWTETVVDWPSEPTAPSALEYEGVTKSMVEEGAYSSNPFVTTVILVGQSAQDQDEIVWAGVGRIRSMIAVVDYSSYILLHFEHPTGTFWETDASLQARVLDGRAEESPNVESAGTLPNNGLFIEYEGGARVEWKADWYQTSPRLSFNGGTTYTLARESETVRATEFAATIAHELGHTFGLCHPHEEACLQNMSAADQADAAESTMSYDAPSDRLHFLPGEWDTVQEYVDCPTLEAVRAVSRDASAAAVKEAKYGSLGSQRFCAQAITRPLNLTYVADAFEFHPDEDDLDAPLPSHFRGFAVTGAIAAAAIGGIAAVLTLGRRPS